jgi:tripartite ATP-independent transporter DctM subunit
MVELLYARMFDLLTTYILLAVPLFIYMGNMLERSGVTERMYDALYEWLGGFKGGLAVTTVVIGTILAACVGVIAASVTMLALIALPSMIKKGYSRALASGVVCASGTLGILIPPSIMLVLYGPMAGISVGRLFLGAIVPGLVLSGLYCCYIALRCFFQPELGPSIPADESVVSFTRKVRMLFISLIPAVIIILAVLGSIMLGIATPTEAAAVGAFASTLLAVAYRRFSWQILREVALGTVKLSSMILFIVTMASTFVGVFMRAGGGGVVEDLILALPFGRWGIFVSIMIVIFLLGKVMDWIGILFLVIPIVTPIIPMLGFDPLWFALMVCINLQASFLTPPLAYAVFFVKVAAPPELGITIGEVIRGIFPFVGIIGLALGLCTAFPQIILWLPAMMR